MTDFSDKLLFWYDHYHRTLPWRIAPADILKGEKPDPYRVWLSEVMLQQTTVEAVKPYFKKFVTKWPDVFSLAKADLEDVLKAWAGLGYYSRARNLKQCAEQVATDYDGIFPRSLEKLKKLPGIGDYTAAAILSIAYNQPAAVVDGNVERIVARLFAIEEPLPQAKAIIKNKTQDLTPSTRCGDFAQSMMDLGASICTPREPKCMICPVESLCKAKKIARPEAFPVKPPKIKRPQRHGVAFVALNKNDEIYLEKRHSSGLLGGMTQIPNQFGDQQTYSVADAPFSEKWLFKGQAHHIFTHFSLTLDVYLAENVEKTRAGNGWWCRLDQLGNEALPTVMKKAIAVAFPEIFKSEKRKNRTPQKHALQFSK